MEGKRIYNLESEGSLWEGGQRDQGATGEGRGCHTLWSNRTRRHSPLPCVELIPQPFTPIQQVEKTQKAMEMLVVPASLGKSPWSPKAQQLVSGKANTSPSRLPRFGRLCNVAMVRTWIFNSSLHSAIYFVQKSSQTSSLFIICYFLRSPTNPHFSSLPDYIPSSFTTKSSSGHDWMLLVLLNGSCTRLDAR